MGAACLCKCAERLKTLVALPPLRRRPFGDFRPLLGRQLTKPARRRTGFAPFAFLTVFGPILNPAVGDIPEFLTLCLTLATGKNPGFPRLLTF